MAIKGKRKSKRRAVTTGPKPVYVPPKKPILARRGFWIAVGAVALAGAAAGLVTGFMIKRSNDRMAAEREIVVKFASRVDATLQGVGQSLGPTFRAFPTLSQSIGGFKNGDVKPGDALSTAKTVADQASTVYDELLRIPTASLVDGHSALDDLKDSQYELSDGMQMYEQVAVSLRLAAQASGSDRKRLIAHAEDLLAVASNTFTTGYAKLTKLRSQYGISTAPPAPVPIPTQ
jgi:hypothetical protein